MSAHYRWLNEPAAFRGDATMLELTTQAKTDFWQHTFYGFERDNGHAYLRPISGDFTASVIARGSYEALYDQAGLMLRIDQHSWIKAGVEYTDGLMHFSVVVTNRISDWSVIPLRDACKEDDVRIQLSRHGDAVRVQFAVNDAPWQLARLAPFSSADAQIGIMACSPERSGFEATFRELHVGPPISRNLHGG